MSKAFGSVIASPMRAFVRSPLGVRETGGPERAVYMIVGSVGSRDGHGSWEDEKLFKVSVSDLSTPILEVRPPWWPATHPDLGRSWAGSGISGDSETVWYAAWNTVARVDWTATPDPIDERWVIDIYKLNGNLEVVNSWRWHQPELGSGRVWRIAPFGDSTALWGLAFVHRYPQPWRLDEQEMYLVELDPETMEIRRSSSDLWGSFSDTVRLARPYVPSGGGNSSVIWASRAGTLVDGRRRDQILEYSPDDFRLVRSTDGPRSGLTGDTRRLIGSIGGNSQSIWLNLFWGAVLQNAVSELPRDFSNENRVILQDEIAPPVLGTGSFERVIDIG